MPAANARESSGGIMRRKWFVRYPFTVDVFAKNGTSFDVLIDGKQSDIMFYNHNEDAEGATQTVLGLSMQTWAVMYHFFLDAAGLGPHRHPCRDETVHLTIQPHFLDHRGAVDLEAATIVVQAYARDVANQSIGEVRWDRSQPDVVLPVLSPADDQIEMPVQQAINESG